MPPSLLFLLLAVVCITPFLDDVTGAVGFCRYPAQSNRSPPHGSVLVGLYHQLTIHVNGLVVFPWTVDLYWILNSVFSAPRIDAGLTVSALGSWSGCRVSDREPRA